MKPVRQILILAAAFAAVIAVLALIRPDLIPVVVVILVLVILLIDGLWEGEIRFGQRNAKTLIQKKESPAAYWAVIALYAGALFASVFLAFGEKAKPRTKQPEVNPTIEKSDAQRPTTAASLTGIRK